MPEIDLIKALKAIRFPGGPPEFEGTDKEAVALLTQAKLPSHLESDALVNTAWELRRKLIEIPEWVNFSLAVALLLTAEDQNPEIEQKQIWLRAHTNFEDGVTAIQLLLQAAERQKPNGGF